MNKKQRILFTSVVSIVGLIEGLIIFALMELEVSRGALAILMIFLATLPLAAGIYFLSFKIWDKAEQVSGEDRRPRTGRITNRRQRILLALVITFVLPVNLFLVVGLDELIGEHLVSQAFWMLIPTSIIMVVGVYFLSFKIWDKKKQEVREDQEQENSFTKRQRILLALIISSVIPVEIYLAAGLDELMGVNLVRWMLIPIIMAVGVYYLSFKIWDKKKQEVREDQEPENSLTNKQRTLYALIAACALPAIIVGGVAFIPLGVLGDDNVFFIIFLSLSSLIVAVLVYFLSFKIWKREDQEPENSLTKKQRILYALVTVCSVPAVVGVILAIEPLGVSNIITAVFLSSPIVAVLVYFLSFKIWKREDQETENTLTKKQRILYALVTVYSVPAVAGGLAAFEALGGHGDDNVFLIIFLSSLIVTVLVYFLSFMIWKREDRGAEERKKKILVPVLAGMALLVVLGVLVFTPFGTNFFSGAPSLTVLIPAGEFEMGMDADRALVECQKYSEPYNDTECELSSFENEEPVHEIYLDVYYIDQYEVTNAAYQDCVEAGTCDPPEEFISNTRDSYYGNSAYDEYPVVNVSWEDANTYCEWRGGRLPTEAEWEKAARGTDGRMYPWGDEFDGAVLNFCDQECEFDYANTEYNDGYAGTAPVGSYPGGASPYGVMDMAGNVWEWVSDWSGEDYYANSPAENPLGPASGEDRRLRGGGWWVPANYVSAAYRLRDDPDHANGTIGFRCAASPERNGGGYFGLLVSGFLIVAVLVYFLSFKIWKREDRGAEERKKKILVPVLAGMALLVLLGVLVFTPFGTRLFSRSDWKIVFEDQFNSNENSWNLGLIEGDSDSFQSNIENGKLRLSAKSETNIRVGEVFYPSQSPYSNFKLSIDVELIEGISARPNYGIFFRYTSDNDNYYSFQLNGGFYAFFINFGETFEPIIDWRPTSIIKPNGKNHITVIAVGSEFTFIINDEVVAIVQDDRLSKGKLGVEFQIGEGETLIEFDNLKIWVPGDSKYNNPINSITPTNETN